MNKLLKSTIFLTLQEFPEIQQAIVFGSTAKGKENSLSDLDIGIMTDKPLELHQKTLIIEALAEATGRAIDLIDLKTAGQPLLGQIITRGIRIMGSDTDYAKLITKNLFDQADFLPYRNRILDERRETWIGK